MLNRDISDVAAIYRQPSCVYNSLHTPFMSEDDWNERVRYYGNNMQAMVAEKGGQVIGQCCLIQLHNEPRRRHVASLGVVVSEEWRKQGVAKALLTEVLDICDSWLGVHRIELEVFADNLAAISLYRSLGFVEEGLCRDFALRDGEYANALIMSRVKGA